VLECSLVSRIDFCFLNTRWKPSPTRFWMQNHRKVRRWQGGGILRPWLCLTENRLKARAFTFGGTEGLMLGRRGWFDAVTKRFDAGKKGMVQCCDKKNGLLLNRRKTNSFRIF
jgi:hypothetical protein